MAKTYEQLAADILEVIKDNGGSSPDKTRGVTARQLLLDIIEAIFAGSGGGSGSGIQLVADVTALKALNTTSAVDYPEARPVILQNLKKIMLLHRASGATPDNINIVKPTTGPGMWIDILYTFGMTDGAVYHYYWTLNAHSQKVFTLPEAFPDIKPNSPVILSIGGHLQIKTLSYSVTTRTVTVIGDYNTTVTPIGTLIYFVYDIGTGTGGGSTGGGGEPGEAGLPVIAISTDTDLLTIEESFDAETEQQTLEFTPHPDTVTNPVNAQPETPALVGAIMLATILDGSEIESSGVVLLGPKLTDIPDAWNSPGIVGQVAFDSTTKDSYEVYEDSRWRKIDLNGVVSTNFVNP